jgi:phosphoribosylaminoimidazole-succinocarboxamide synthase
MNGVVSESIYNQMEGYTRALFRRGTEMAASRGLILVDTKYEFGITDGSVVLMDEIHTPDSSRFFLLEGYSDRQALGIRQSQLSKEFVREWLIANGFQGLEGQKMPSMPDEFVREVSSRYVALYERLIGQPFIRRPDTPTLLEDMQARVCAALRALH